MFKKKVDSETRAEGQPANATAAQTSSVVVALLKNKYLLAGLFFLVWMLFFDPKDLSTELGRMKKYQELQASEQQMLMQIKATKEELGELKNNAQTIEKYAREKYLMKKENEDLFLVNPSKE